MIDCYATNLGLSGSWIHQTSANDAGSALIIFFFSRDCLSSQKKIRWWRFRDWPNGKRYTSSQGKRITKKRSLLSFSSSLVDCLWLPWWKKTGEPTGERLERFIDPTGFQRRTGHARELPGEQKRRTKSQNQKKKRYLDWMYISVYRRKKKIPMK